MVSLDLDLIRTGQDLHLISHIFSRLSRSVVGPKLTERIISAAGKADQEHTCATPAHADQEKRAFFFQRERLPWCVFALGLTNKVITGQRWAATADQWESICPHWSTDSRRTIGAKGIR